MKEEKSAAAGDFFMRSRRGKSEYRLMYQHGLAFTVLMTVVVLSSQLILGTLSNIIDLMFFSVIVSPNLLTSPFVSSAVFLVIAALAMVLIAFGFGYLNRRLTERLWKEKQSHAWDRQVGLGLTLVSVLLIVHLPLLPMYMLWYSGLAVEQIVFLIIYVMIVPFIDGTIAKYLASLRVD
jgi:hypothetical protein